MEFLGLAGIVIAVVLFLVLAYKGWSTLWVAPVCALIVALFNQLDPVQAIAEHYVTGMTEVIISLFSLIFMGAVFGKVYAETGAASSIAVTLVEKFVQPRRQTFREGLYPQCSVSGRLLSLPLQHLNITILW